MAENWKAECRLDPYIRASLSSNLVLLTHSIVIDRFILCCCRIIDLSVDPGYVTKPTGYLQFLPREQISESHRAPYFKFPPCFHPHFLHQPPQFG